MRSDTPRSPSLGGLLGPWPGSGPFLLSLVASVASACGGSDPGIDAGGVTSVGPSCEPRPAAVACPSIRECGPALIRMGYPPVDTGREESDQRQHLASWLCDANNAPAVLDLLQRESGEGPIRVVGVGPGESPLGLVEDWQRSSCPGDVGALSDRAVRRYLGVVRDDRPRAEPWTECVRRVAGAYDGCFVSQAFRPSGLLLVFESEPREQEPFDLRVRWCGPEEGPSLERARVEPPGLVAEGARCDALDALLPGSRLGIGDTLVPCVREGRPSVQVALRVTVPGGEAGRSLAARSFLPPLDREPAEPRPDAGTAGDGGVGDDAATVDPAAPRFYVRSRSTGACLHQFGGVLGNGGRVSQVDCFDADYVRLRRVPVAEGVFLLQFAHSGRCVRQQNASQASGATLVQWDCVDVPHARFRQIPVPGGPYVQLQLEHSGKCLHASIAAFVRQEDCLDDPRVEWSFEPSP